jgi:transcriptional regulator with XRE-family HTH domain
MLDTFTVDKFSELDRALDSGRVVVPEELGRAVRQRRAELRMTQQEVRAASGLSVTTISKIETGSHDLSVHDSTLRRLDLALQWPVGTAEAWLAGRAGIVAQTPATLDRSAIAAVVPMVIEALQAQSDVSLSTMAYLAQLPEPVRRSFETLIAQVAEALAAS